MSPAVVALLLAAPVVKLGAGSGVVIDDEVLVTTKRVAFDTAKPVGSLDDGGTVKLLQTLETETDLALVAFSGLADVAVLERAMPDAGVLLRVVTGEAVYEARVTRANGSELELEIADAGVVAGAGLLDESGRVWGVVRDDRHAVSSLALAHLLDTLKQPPEQRHGARWRNLGISAVFFLGLCVWWVYRSKRLRY